MKLRERFERPLEQGGGRGDAHPAFSQTLGRGLCLKRRRAVSSVWGSHPNARRSSSSVRPRAPARSRRIRIAGRRLQRRSFEQRRLGAFGSRRIDVDDDSPADGIDRGGPTQDEAVAPDHGQRSLEYEPSGVRAVDRIGEHSQPRADLGGSVVESDRPAALQIVGGRSREGRGAPACGRRRSGSQDVLGSNLLGRPTFPVLAGLPPRADRR